MRHARVSRRWASIPLVAALFIGGLSVSAITSGSASATKATGGTQSSAAAAAAARPKFQMPFACGQKWTFYTWNHSPALDTAVGRKGWAVRAAASGRVVQSYFKQSSAGHIVQIKHKGGYFTTYVHLGKRTVKKGATVKRGARIGTVGNSGDTSNGNVHLHFELAKSGGNTATWGYPGSDRIPVSFNGKRYSGNGKHWTLISHNCAEGKPKTYCNFVVTKAHHKRSWVGTKYDSEGKLSKGAKIRASKYTKKGGGYTWRRLAGSGGADSHGAWVLSSHMRYNTANPGCKLPNP
ncbi:M23 family metallopeptidase [Streptomyces sp. KR80]|uniref:M23 family metallopeptidase n=1 Tax=Streptomyces sp. KR80 TaxID=3457426 RepID=UPI003FD0B212